VLGVDRTSMVALLDALERQGIVARRPSEQDRDATSSRSPDHGWEVYRQAENRYSETERGFTATLGDAGAAGLRQALRTVLSENGPA
jgi:DNA-binding MarR family transcriptional regulator